MSVRIGAHYSLWGIVLIASRTILTLVMAVQWRMSLLNIEGEIHGSEPNTFQKMKLEFATTDPEVKLQPVEGVGVPPTLYGRGVREYLRNQLAP